MKLKKRDTAPHPTYGPDYRFLKSIPVLYNVDDNILVRMAEKLIKRQYAKGSFVFMQGEKVDWLYFLEMGKIEIYKSGIDGKKLTMWFIEPPDVFCLATVYAPYSFATAEAVVDSMAYCISKKDLERLLAEYKELSKNIIQCLATKMATYSSLLDDIAFRNLTSRLAKILLTYSRTDPHGCMVCELPQVQIASLLGSCREVVSRVVKNLKKDGIIDTYSLGKSSCIRICDRERLKSLIG